MTILTPHAHFARDLTAAAHLRRATTIAGGPVRRLVPDQVLREHHAMRSHLLAALALAACAGSPEAPPPAKGSPQLGQQFSLAAQDLEGRPVQLSGSAGRVLVVDFWATWCDPCREELPALDQLAAELGDRGLSVYAVSFDEDRAQIPPFLEEVKVRFPVVWDQGGEANASRFGIERLPTTILVDKKGVVRFVHEGYNPRIAAQQRREIEMLLAE
jgi:cytochrome c biogenesis protein CcmG, thiol:disulfide interchange protein DsbE